MAATTAMPDADLTVTDHAEAAIGTANVSIAVRLVAGAVITMLLVVTVMAGMGAVLRTSAPAQALSVSPWNAQAAGLLSQQLLLEGPSNYPQAARLVDQALKRDPTVVAAIVTQATIRDIRGDGASALRLFTYAEWLTRRHLPAELWWIEHAVSRGDVSLALRHYDTALRAIRRAPDILFPILGSAINQEPIRRELLNVFARDPSWRQRFLEWLVANGVNSPSAAALLIEMRGRGQEIPINIDGGIERLLVAARDYDAAWNLYGGGRTLRRDQSRDVDFAAAPTERNSPFDWTIVDDQGVASIGPQNGKYVLTFAATGNGGELARQLQILPAGRYDLRDDVQIEQNGEAGDVFWILTCIDGPELGRIRLGEEDVSKGFVVPEKCPAQWLILSSVAGDSLQGSSGTVRKVMLQSRKP